MAVVAVPQLQRCNVFIRLSTDLPVLHYRCGALGMPLARARNSREVRRNQGGRAPSCCAASGFGPRWRLGYVTADGMCSPPVYVCYIHRFEVMGMRPARARDARAEKHKRRGRGPKRCVEKDCPPPQRRRQCHRRSGSTAWFCCTFTATDYASHPPRSSRAHCAGTKLSACAARLHVMFTKSRCRDDAGAFALC